MAKHFKAVVLSILVVLFTQVVFTGQQTPLAQPRPDFSGVFIRTSGQGQISGAPVILSISQSPQTLSVTARLNGETLVTNYNFGFILQADGALVKIKGKNLIIKSQTDFKMPQKLPTTRFGLVPIGLPSATSVRTTEK